MKKESIKKLVFVVLLILVSLFSNGKFTLFFAIWISTAMLLYAARRFSTILGFLFSWLFLTLIFIFQFYEIVLLPLPFHILTMTVTALISALPILIDLLFSKNRKNFLHTLIFPTSAVIIGYLYYKYHPYGTWGHLAYTQHSQLILLQSVSIFGLGYITFIISWFASVINWTYHQNFNWNIIKKGAVIFSLVLGLTMAYGSFRILFQNPQSDTIRIASISALPEMGIYDNDLWGLNLEGGKEIFKKQTTKLNNNLFNRSIKEAKAGAKIVFWAEGNSLILKEDELKFYEYASQVAENNKIFLGIAAGIIDPKNDKPLENKFIFFNPKGEKVIDYWKAIPVPGFESNMSNIKDSKIQKTKTSYGIISAVICFDMDFPDHLKTANGVDILLVPSNDWKAIDPIHTQMASFRALEQGFNMIRQTSKGLSSGFDYMGRSISEMDHFTDENKVLITQLPTKGTNTIYSIIGDTFIVFCLLLLILVIIILKKKKSGKVNS
jgi:apolipoprotein N-acyltransferase